MVADEAAKQNQEVTTVINFGSRTQKAINIQNLIVNGSKYTYFDVYTLNGNTWVHDGRKSVDGWLKTGNGCLRKFYA